MAVYSINDIEKLCGIKAHTIRIWEKRYNIITPRRTETNIRYYLDEDLQKILNISLLNRNNYKISKIAQMTDSEMKTLVSQLSDVTIEKEDNLDSLMFAMLELDEYKFNKILDHNISSRGFEETMNEVVYPLMEKLSMMWVAGSIKPSTGRNPRIKSALYALYAEGNGLQDRQSWYGRPTDRSTRRAEDFQS